MNILIVMSLHYGHVHDVLKSVAISNLWAPPESSINNTNNRLSANCSARINKHMRLFWMHAIFQLTLYYSICCCCCVALGRLHTFILMIRFTDWINDLMTNRFETLYSFSTQIHYPHWHRSALFLIWTTTECCSFLNRKFTSVPVVLHENLVNTRIRFESHKISQPWNVN